MTQKTSTEKVTKNIERPKPIRGNREVIRHFDPSTNTAAPYSNLDQNIPLVNVDPSEQKSASKPNKTVKISKASRTFKQNNKCRINLDIKSSSSSSLETKIKKFQSKSLKGGQPKIKSKSFHLGPTFTKPNENVVSNARERQLPAKPQNVVSSARERQLPAKPKNNTRLRSSTDPALLKKELNVRILKQEILDNKRETVQRALHPDAWVPIIDPRVEGLKSEILQSKTKNILNKKIFITELKSEVARYKHYENFMVYNVEEDEKKKQENNKQHLSNKKVPIGSEKPVALLYQNQKLQPNIDPSSDKSNRESNTSASTDRQEDCSGSSSTTAKEICKAAFVSRDHSDTESLDDEALKNKIEEANQLINEVKRALGKIKAVKNSGGRSSSTDIEETIEKLKKDSARLMIGKENVKPCPACPKQPEESRKERVQNIIISDIPSFSEQVPREALISSPGVSQPKKRIEQNLIKHDIPCSSKQLPDEDPISSSQEPSRKSSEETQIEDEIRKVSDKAENERPKTRRNETEDELSEQLRREKFRSSLDPISTLIISSSLEELQEKLQTISETTESSNSTPRQKSINPLTEKSSKGCNTTTTHSEHKEIQVQYKPFLTNVGVGCRCLTKDKNLQFTPQKNLTIETTISSSLSPKIKSLDNTNLPVQEIKPIGKCDSYRIERLPAIETVTPSTEKTLTMENIDAVSLPTKMQKKMLKIQHLPDIIIGSGLTFTPVLNLSISARDQSKNYVKNTENCQYIEIVHGSPNDDEIEVSSVTFLERTKSTREERAIVAVQSQKSFENASKSMSKLMKSESEKWSELLKSHRFTENEAEEFLKDFESMESDSKLTAEQEREMQQKLLYYKSYHIYDNPNDHNPGELPTKSISKFSQMDIDVYKTFINPNPNVSDEENFAGSSRNLTKTKYGFESKMVQCSDSELILSEPDRIESNASEEIELESELSKVNKSTSMQIISEKNSDLHDDSIILPVPQGLSETVLNVNEKSEESIESITADKKSSLSEITLTISYTLSSEGSQSSYQIPDRENSAANSKITDITKTFSVADKDVISRLQKKLKSVNTEDSIPTFKMSKTAENCETIDNFLKGLTHFEERESGNLRKNMSKHNSRLEQRRQDRKYKNAELNNHKEVQTEERKSMRDGCSNEDYRNTKNGKQQDKQQEDPENGASQEPSTDKKPKNNPTVNYLIQQTMLQDPYKHLELGKNGRYKDEETSFTNFHHPNKKYIKRPMYSKDIRDAKTTLVQRDREVALERFRPIPRDRFERHSPETSNSERLTTTSVSEGEVLCRHSISNGEIHVCRPAIPRFRSSRSSITKRHLSYTPKYRCPRPRSHFHKVSVSPRRFDLNDPTVSIEQRRNYFNNWVTYYVQSQSTPNSYNKQE